jgi:DNA-directed RNA polymerase subunit RPC12/RpoP
MVIAGILLLFKGLAYFIEAMFCVVVGAIFILIAISMVVRNPEERLVSVEVRNVKGLEDGTEVEIYYVDLVKKGQKGLYFEEKVDTKVFFPEVSISNANNLKGVYLSREEMDKDSGIWLEGMFDPVLKLCTVGDKPTGEIWVYGQDDKFRGYFAKFYAPSLYDKIKIEYEKIVRERLEEEKMQKQKELEEKLKIIRYLETVGRYEEAARIYEELDMPEKAGEMRRKKREIVTLNLNALIRQLGERGFTITYHCSNCGAPVSISGETKAEAVQYCSYCGSRIETIDLANFIKKYLS